MECGWYYKTIQGHSLWPGKFLSSRFLESPLRSTLWILHLHLLPQVFTAAPWEGSERSTWSNTVQLIVGWVNVKISSNFNREMCWEEMVVSWKFHVVKLSKRNVWEFLLSSCDGYSWFQRQPSTGLTLQWNVCTGFLGIWKIGSAF